MSCRSSVLEKGKIQMTGSPRDFFVPAQENWLLLAADYSQIELRLMARFSKDPSLVELLTIIWVEHTEYDESSIHHLYRPLLRSGMGFGAQKWVATLQRHCDFLATIMPSAGPTKDLSVITPTGKTSMEKLAQRMTRNFCAGVCATTHNWEVVQVGNVGKGERLMTRKSVHSLGEPSGIVLCATLSIMAAAKDVQSKKEIYAPFNILPVDSAGSSQAIMQLEEVKAAVGVLLNTGGLNFPSSFEKQSKSRNLDILDWLRAMFGFQEPAGTFDFAACQHPH
ncbi:hypothetical protein POM88_046990 [Heracleum sosnowskyi]|uniref:DNA-directed DNA polymerase family A palm domain-containing protein n=1 Tax=Heracleum sosnowskyi TaxID=360622 RepID=A0AAD8H9M9_9APIA|nr:hypothetical protein POM88_046990 [Heracleum sosnowskyi]